MPETITAIATPDLSTLKVVNFTSMLSLSVVDTPSCEQAKADKAIAKQWIDAVEEKLAEPTAAAHKLHKFFTTMRAEKVKDALAVIAHHDKEVSAYVKKEAAERQALEARLQREADQAANTERLRLEAERQRQFEEDQALAAMGLVPEAPAPPEPVVILAPKVELAAVPVASGFSQANKPWSYEVADLAALLSAIVAGTVKIDPDNPCITVSHKFFAAAAKLYKDKLHTHFPGVKGVREQVTRY